MSSTPPLPIQSSPRMKRNEKERLPVAHGLAAHKAHAAAAETAVDARARAALRVPEQPAARPLLDGRI